ncbi:uncharacterized protein LOC143422356 [Xylocopa sonorina]|uniref:uncharacterized protein LOC143422356 n=1 Tax=Xylocopa sonorina TaxID=1818115 RepID=UPI00403A9708
MPPYCFCFVSMHAIPFDMHKGSTGVSLIAPPTPATGNFLFTKHIQVMSTEDLSLKRNSAAHTSPFHSGLFQNLFFARSFSTIGSLGEVSGLMIGGIRPRAEKYRVAFYVVPSVSRFLNAIKSPVGKEANCSQHNAHTVFTMLWKYDNTRVTYLRLREILSRTP